MNNATTVSFSATMKLLTVADSLIPTTSTNDMIATIAMAGRLTIDPVELRPGVTQPATALATSDASHHRNGAEVRARSEEHTSELQSRLHLVCRLLLEKQKRHPRQGRQAPDRARGQGRLPGRRRLPRPR